MFCPLNSGDNKGEGSIHRPTRSWHIQLTATEERGTCRSRFPPTPTPRLALHPAPARTAMDQGWEQCSEREEAKIKKRNKGTHAGIQHPPKVERVRVRIHRTGTRTNLGAEPVEQDLVVGLVSKTPVRVARRALLRSVVRERR